MTKSNIHKKKLNYESTLKGKKYYWLHATWPSRKIIMLSDKNQAKKSTDCKISFTQILENNIQSVVTKSRLAVSWEGGKAGLGGRERLKKGLSNFRELTDMFIIFFVAIVSHMSKVTDYTLSLQIFTCQLHLIRL